MRTTCETLATTRSGEVRGEVRGSKRKRTERWSEAEWLEEGRGNAVATVTTIVTAIAVVVVMDQDCVGPNALTRGISRS